MKIYTGRISQEEASSKKQGANIVVNNVAGDVSPLMFTHNGELLNVCLTHKDRVLSQKSNDKTYSPITSTNLKLLVRRGSGITETSFKFEQWDDLSRQNNHLTSVVPNPQVPHGYAVFDGAGQYFSTTTALSMSEFTICVALRNDRAKLGSIVGMTTDADSFIATSYGSGRDITLSLDSGEVYSSSGGDIPTGRDCLITVAKSTSNDVYMRVNGVQVHTELATATALQIDEIARQSTNADTFKGNMYELAIYDRHIGGEELDRIELGMISRNRITV